MALRLNNYTGFETGGLEEAIDVGGSPDATEEIIVRTGSRSLKMTGARYNLSVDDLIADAGDGHIFGFAFYAPDVTPSGGDSLIFAAGPTDEYIDVYLQSNGDIKVTDDTISTIFTATAPLSVNTWHYIEVYVAGWTASSAVELFVDGYSIGSDTGDTRASGAELTPTYWKINHSANMDDTSYFDDLYILTGATAASQRFGEGFEVYAYQNTNTTDTGDGGALGNAATASTSGTWDDTANLPLNTGTEIVFNDSAAGGSVDSSALGSEVDGTIIGIKGIWNADRDGGGGTTHTIVLGDDNDGDSPTSEGAVSLASGSPTNFFALRETNLPAETDKIRQGMWVAGAQDLHIMEMWAMLAHVADVGAGTQTITGAAFVDTDAFGTGSIATGGVTITGVAYVDPDAFGSGTINATYNITGVSHVDGDTFGAGTITVGPTSITGVSYVDPDAFGAGTIAAGAVIITGVSHVDADAFGVGTISATYDITGASHVDGDAFGTGSISTGAVTITGVSYVDVDAFGSGTIAASGGTQTITGASYVDSDAFGVGDLSTSYEIIGLSYSDLDAFGSGIIGTGIVAITGASFADTDAFGSGTMGSVYNIDGSPYVDTDAFGSGTVSTTVTITGVSYVDDDAFGFGTIIEGTRSSARSAGPANSKNSSTLGISNNIASIVASKNASVLMSSNNASSIVASKNRTVING